MLFIGKNKNPGCITAILDRHSTVLAVILGIFGLLVPLAFASWLTTSTSGDDFLPSGEYILYIENQSGKPIEGAILNVYVGDEQVPVNYFPLGAYFAKTGLKSNVDGVIIIDHPPKYMEMDSDGWALFWLFPMINGNENYNCEITANGYKPLRLPLDRLIEVVVRNPFNTRTTKVTFNGQDLKLNIYELRLILQEQ